MSRVAVVTGGTRGIGAAISRALKSAGCKVAVPQKMHLIPLMVAWRVPAMSLPGSIMCGAPRGCTMAVALGSARMRAPAPPA